MDVIEEKLKNLPTNPGVYVMLNSDKVVIYVGKAKNLKNRVRQYFFNTVKTQKVSAMVKNIADFYYYIVPSEIDALSLENNLIKKYKPRYNILLKDDKTYPYIKVDLKENFPTFKITRKIKKDGAKYFGPFMGGINVGDVLELINYVFLVRPCDKKLNEKKAVRPCLNYHIKKCSAPCSFLISREEYFKGVNNAIDFLSGNIADTESLLYKKMTESAEKEEFELALKLKGFIASLDKIKLKRLTALNRFIMADVISFVSNGVYSAINVLFIRNGIMLGGKNFSFNTGFDNGNEALNEFVLRYYKFGEFLPDELIFGEEVSDLDLLSKYFINTFNKSVTLTVAKKGVKRQLYEMAERNAREHLTISVDKIKHKDDMTVTACKLLQEKLGLKNFPHRMECYDISNISGVDKVGSMVVFTDGEKDGESYRRFKIKTVEGANDFESLKEVMRRRLDRLKENDEKFPKPDLIIIDGGKGQLSSIKQVFDEYNITDIDLISLAERLEEVFLVDKEQSVLMPKTDYCLKILIRIRDEAHRFAITYFRSLHGKNSLSSVLDEVEGLGKVKRQALIEKFKDLSGIISATKEQLMEVNGIGENLADNIIKRINKEGH